VKASKRLGFATRYCAWMNLLALTNNELENSHLIEGPPYLGISDSVL
jgi:hypothetical protein